ncbi:Uncharacterized hydrolase YugF [Galdieria sulphuraria]|nr:Uncharacterized hydrolase YugF [Galdieria sulphuraria]
MNCAFLTSCDCVLRRNWFRSFSVNRKFTRNIKSLKRIYLSIQADSSQVDKTLLESDLALKYFQYKAIVCVHGFGATCGHWKHNIPYLSKVFGSVYAVDLLGFGASDKPSPVRTSVAYTFEEWAAQVNAFVKEVVQKPVILIANSIGCIVAMQAAVESPENYIGLVALNPSLRLLSKKKRRGLKALFATCIAALLRFQPNIGASLLRQKQSAQEVFVEFTNYSEGATPEELLDKLRLPVAILWGENDPWEPVTLGMNLKQFPCVRRFITLPKVGHCPHDEAPEVVNPLLEDTIKDFMSSR